MTAVRRKSEFVDDRETKKPRKKEGGGFAKVCVKLIDELISYPAGWIFSHPVDPVKLKIPDYFYIIKKPMDLGTVKCNLKQGLYFDVEEFAADVRLVFSNAMMYNPPSSVAHVLAKKLNFKFNMGWRLIKARLKSGDMDDGQKDSLSKRIAATGLKRGVGKGGNCRGTSLETKQNTRVRDELEGLLSDQVVGDVQTLFRKLGLTSFTKEKLHSYLRSCDDESLQKLRREVGAFLNAKHEKVKSAHMAQKGGPALKKPMQRENHDQSACGLDNNEQAVDPKLVKSVRVAQRGGPALKKPMQRANHDQSACGLDNHGLAVYPKLVKSAHKAHEGFLALKTTVQRENCNQHPCKLDNQGQSVDRISDFEVRPPLVRHSSSSYSESDRPKVVQNPDDCPRVSTPPTDASSLEGFILSCIEMSPRHALRAAMLKKRFADTIFKATHQEPEKKGQNSDFASRRKERDRLLKEQQQEKAKIEAEIRAAEAALRRSRDNSETKFKRYEQP